MHAHETSLLSRKKSGPTGGRFCRLISVIGAKQAYEKARRAAASLFFGKYIIAIRSPPFLWIADTVYHSRREMSTVPSAMGASKCRSTIQIRQRRKKKVEE